MPRILDCPDCDWKTKPKHQRPKQALTLHRKGAHRTYPTIQEAIDAQPAGGTVVVEPGTYHEQLEVPENIDIRGRPGFLITFTNGEERHVPAEEYQETVDRHWFFRGGALKESYKRVNVREVVAV